MLDLSLGDWGIWYEKVWAAIYLVPSNTKFWRFIFWKFEIMMSSCMTKLKFLRKPDIIYIFRWGKPLLIYAACFALSLVKLCCIPYERFVMLLKSRSRTHHPYIHNSYTRNRHNHSSFSTQIHLKMFSPTIERTPKNLTYRTALNKYSNFLLQSLSNILYAERKGMWL
jgi:hypothetical protein